MDAGRRALLVRLFREGAVTPWDPDGRIDVESVQYDLQWYRERGIIDRELSVAELVDPQYAEYAVSLLGPSR